MPPCSFLNKFGSVKATAVKPEFSFSRRPQRTGGLPIGSLRSSKRRFGHFGQIGPPAPVVANASTTMRTARAGGTLTPALQSHPHHRCFRLISNIQEGAARGHGRRCCRAGTLIPSGDSTIRDQLSLAGTIISVAAEAEEPVIEQRLWRTASERNTKMLAGWQVGSTLTPGASSGASFTILPLSQGLPMCGALCETLVILRI